MGSTGPSHCPSQLPARGLPTLARSLTSTIIVNLRSPRRTGSRSHIHWRAPQPHTRHAHARRRPFLATRGASRADLGCRPPRLPRRGRAAGGAHAEDPRRRSAVSPRARVCERVEAARSLQADGGRAQRICRDGVPPLCLAACVHGSLAPPRAPRPPAALFPSAPASSRDCPSCPPRAVHRGRDARRRGARCVDQADAGAARRPRFVSAASCERLTRCRRRARRPRRRSTPRWGVTSYSR